MEDDRDQWLTLAHFAQSCGRFDDMWRFTRGLVQCAAADRKRRLDSTTEETSEIDASDAPPSPRALLTADEKTALQTAVRRVLLERRDACRACYTTLQHCQATREQNSEAQTPNDLDRLELLTVQAHKMKYELEIEMERIVEGYTILLDRHLLSKYAPVRSCNVEDATFYHLLKADCYRYLCEMATGRVRQRHAKQCLAHYRTTMDYASHLDPSHPLRLSTSLNIMVFYMEILDKRAAACRLGLAAVVNAWQSIKDPESIFSTERSTDAHDVYSTLHAIVGNARMWYAQDEERARAEQGQLWSYTTILMGAHVQTKTEEEEHPIFTPESMSESSSKDAVTI